MNSANCHQVFRVSSHKAADLRRFLPRHAKSNSIDAGALARLPAQPVWPVWGEFLRHS
jgi:hypothetical protein